MTAREQAADVDVAARLRVTTDALAAANARAERWKVRRDDQQRRAECAEAAYRQTLQWWHEADPDHCGGECFRESSIRAALTGPTP
jgi:hypothetical protein